MKLVALAVLDAPGEACETGTGNDTACPGACDLQTCTCPLPSCGDGNLDAGEECDAGSANANNAACTTTCKTNVCGDSFINVGVEQCDDGNAIDTDFCTTTCTVVCGDGFLQRWNGEECDLTSAVPGTGCDAQWTGIDTPFAHCSDWTDGSNSGAGGISDLGVTHATRETATSFACDGLSAPTRMFCVQTN